MLLGMSAAAQRAGMTREGVRRALQSAGVPLVRIHARALAVDESDLAAFIARRGKNPGPGRPRGSVKKRSVPSSQPEQPGLE